MVFVFLIFKIICEIIFWNIFGVDLMLKGKCVNLKCLNGVLNVYNFEFFLFSLSC